MIHSIEALRDVHKGENVFLLSSGKSLDFYPEGFFRDVLAIGINKAAEHFPCAYTVYHHHNITPRLLKTDTIHVRAEYDCARTDQGILHRHLLALDDRIHYEFKTPEQTFTKLALPGKGEHLAEGGTSAVIALDFCRWIGAKRVFLCGHDAVPIEGETNFTGYYSKEERKKQNKVYSKGYIEHLELSRHLIHHLIESWPDNAPMVVGINPFLDFYNAPV